ncbi:MAG TPA: MOSC domain-containing protein, partial [Chloroflexota bacterium]|nr:MOSC domain-containing protein [Chloroflexota bacterium]
GLARLTVRYDHQRRRLGVWQSAEPLVAAGLDPAGRQAIAQAIAAYVQPLDDNPLVGHPERLPLRLVGDGRTPQHHDSEAGEVTLHGRASVGALGGARGDPDLSEVRFRSNTAV